MEHIRIAVLDQNDNVLSFLDNEAEEATHYYDDELHEYLKGAASTFFLPLFLILRLAIHWSLGIN